METAGAFPTKIARARIDVSKMHTYKIILYFSFKQVNNGKCITAVRGSLPV